MSDIFKKIENDGKDIQNDAFFDRCVDDYKKLFKTMQFFTSIEGSESFSTDLDKFNANCSEFISYIRQCFENNELSVLYMLREGNVIHYGQYDNGRKREKDFIEMISDDDLKELYELMKKEFLADFCEGCTHTMVEGWSLSPTIGKKLMIEIKSSSLSDRNWFFKESHNEVENDIAKKK